MDSEDPDIVAVDQLRVRRVVSQAIRVDHGRLSAEPWLWLADLVAGAVSAEGDDPAPPGPDRADLLTEYRIELD